MKSLRPQIRQSAKLTALLGALAAEHPEAFEGVGALLPGARPENQPLDRRKIKSAARQLQKNNDRVQKQKNLLQKAQLTRDERLLRDLPHLRATLKRIKVLYPNHNHPVRKRLEELMKV